jgi:hypothetical protein
MSRLELSRANSLAMERMREMDENETRQRMNTKQKHGTPIVSFP